MRTDEYYKPPGGCVSRAQRRELEARWLKAIEVYLDKRIPTLQPADDIKSPYAARIVLMDAETFDEAVKRPWWGISFGRVC